MHFKSLLKDDSWIDLNSSTVLDEFSIISDPILT